MYLEHYIKLRNLGKRNFGITIPATFIKALGWQIGQELAVVLDTEQKILLVKPVFMCVRCGAPVSLLEQEEGVIEYKGKQGYLCAQCREEIT